MPKRYLWWIPCLLWMGAIFFFSSQPYEKQDLRPELHWVPGEQVERYFSGVSLDYAGHEVSIGKLGVAGFVEFFIRKGAHLFMFFVLGLLVSVALEVVRGRLFLAALVICLLYAGSDEWHQWMTGGRTPLVQDVLLDTVGAAFGILAFMVVRSLGRKRTRTGAR